VEEADWEDLLAVPIRPLRAFTFTLHSPTAHHAVGELRKSIVLPTTGTLLRQWLGRWNICCPTKFDDAALKAMIEQQVAVTPARARQRQCGWINPEPSSGFKEPLRFALLQTGNRRARSQNSPDRSRPLRLVLRYGVDTMRGMAKPSFAGKDSKTAVLPLCVSP